MLSILTGRGGSGKTGRIFREIAAEPGPSILIVPEQFSHDAERELAGIGGPEICLRAEVLTFGRIAELLLGETECLDDGGRLLAIRTAMGQLEGKLRALGHGGVSGLTAIARTVDELKTHMITPEALKDAADMLEQAVQGPKLHDLSLILAAYDALTANIAMDPRDRLTRLVSALDGSEFGRDVSLFVDGFQDFTPQEMAALEKLILRAGRAAIALTYDESEDDITPFTLAGKTLARLEAFAKERDIEVRKHRLEGVRRGSPGLRALERGLFDYSAAPLDSPCADIEIYNADSRYSECEYAAHIALKLAREHGYRFKDIAVVARGFGDYANMLEGVFESYGVPLFTSGMEEILKKPVVSAVLAALEAVSFGFDYRHVFAYLKSGFSCLEPHECDILENYVRAWEIRGSQWQKPWKWNPGGFSKTFTDEDAKALELICGLRDRTLASLGRLMAIKADTALNIAREVFAFMEDIELEPGLSRRESELIKSGRLRQAEECRQLWGYLTGALEQCGGILGGMRMELSEFTDVFRLALSQYKVGSIPVSLDRVSAGEAEHMRRRRVSCLIVLGATVQALPKVSEPSSLFSDNDRGVLAMYGIDLASNADFRLARELSTVYSIFSMPSERLYVTWPSVTLEEQAPSTFIARMRRLLPGLEITSGALDEIRSSALTPCLELAAMAKQIPGEISAAARRVFSGFPGCAEYLSRADDPVKPRGPLSRETADALLGIRPALSASRLDTYRQCRFRHFLEHGLRLRPRRKMRYDPMEHGKLIHFMLEDVFREVMNQGGIERVTDSRLRELSDASLGRYIDERLGGLEDKTARFRNTLSRLESSARRVVENVARELRQSEFEPVAFEYAFSGVQGTLDGKFADDGLSLTGVIDRIDVWKDKYIRVIDYKSGSRRFRLGDVWNGLNMQMLIYLFALEAMDKKGITPAGVLYVPTRDLYVTASRRISEEEAREAASKALKRSGLILNNSEVIAAMDTDMENGSRFLPVRLRKDGQPWTTSQVADSAQFSMLRKLVGKRLEGMFESLKSGDIEAVPCVDSTERSACEFCDFAPACHFDPGYDAYDRLRPIDEKTFWELLSGEVE